MASDKRPGSPDGTEKWKNEKTGEPDLQDAGSHNQ